MSGFFSLRRLVAAAILVSAVSGVGTLLAQTAPAIPTTSGPAMPPPASMPDPNAPIAIINGRPINNAAFNNIMMQVAGMRVFQQVFDLSLVQGACRDAGVPLEGTDFQKRLDAELDKTMDGLNIAKTADGKTLTREQRLNVLGGIIQQQGITAVEFRLGLETRAGLRALSEGKITVTDAELSDAYQSEYGEKRKVHIISYGEKDSPVAIRAALNSKNADGTLMTPEDVAKKLSLAAPAVWVISKNAKNIEEIRKVVFDTLNTKGQVSAETEVAGNNGTKQKILIVLDEITPDKTPTTPFAGVKADLNAKVFDFKQAQWMNNHLATLRGNAVVDIKDPTLSDMFKQVSDAIQKQAAAAAAATQPGAATTGALPTVVPATAPMLPKIP